ncbi:hypothetical protein PVAP13_8NG274400 [Panicum virgatum]|nr:hypothetical protein PVAP13_8NG274400 [Panicum virgatum]
MGGVHRRTWRPRVGVQRSGIRSHGWDRRRRGTWWDRVYKRIAVEGKDFVADTQDGVSDEFEFIPDLDEEDGGTYPMCTSATTRLFWRQRCRKLLTMNRLDSFRLMSPNVLWVTWSKITVRLCWGKTVKHQPQLWPRRRTISRLRQLQISQSLRSRLPMLRQTIRELILIMMKSFLTKGQTPSLPSKVQLPAASNLGIPTPEYTITFAIEFLFCTVLCGSSSSG